ncbi:unnamed protein product, partial [Iphiclides podalirius]
MRERRAPRLCACAECERDTFLCLRCLAHSHVPLNNLVEVGMGARGGEACEGARGDAPAAPPRWHSSANAIQKRFIPC